MGIKTYSDGYNVKFSVTIVAVSNANNAGYGACFNVATGPGVCMSAYTASSGHTVAANNSYTKWLKDKEVADNLAKAGTAKIWLVGTAMTLATQGLKMTPDPTKTMANAYQANAVFTAFWYQPKETKDKNTRMLSPDGPRESLSN